MAASLRRRDHEATMQIRKAQPEDAEAVSRVLIASITELCEADHHGKRESIERWTANKSPDSLRQWMGNTANHMFVAEERGDLLGVGLFNDSGEIQLNYVAPKARFTGVSKAMLARLEQEMLDRGIREARLTSTTTALALYRSAGWREHGSPVEEFGLHCYPMRKALGRAGA